jgi:sulfoacetaldehyde acetyltransferase
VSKISGSEALVEALRLEGVEVVFGLVGSAFMDPLDLFPRAGIRFVQVRHEQSAALMAEGYARATGKPGVCIGQNGPGITNLVTGVASAFLNHVPLVVITPTVTSATIGTRAMQEIEQMKLLAPIVTWQNQVNRADRISEAIRGAFRAAICNRGPAQVDIPRDFYYGVWEDDGLKPEAYRVDGRFGGADASQIAKAAQLLKTAERPVFLVGQGGVDSDAANAIGRLAGRFGAGVACIWLHNDAFPANHPNALGPIGYGGSKAAMKIMKDADVVLALGTRLNPFGLIPQYDLDYFPRRAKLIHNSINPLEIGARLPISVGLVGDCRAVVSQLLEATNDFTPPANAIERLKQIQKEKKAWEVELRNLSNDDALPMKPRRALMEIASAIPSDAAVVCDVGNVVGTASAYFQFNSAGNWFGAGSLGGIGVGFPSALGVKLARKDQPVVALVGDGAWSMCLQEVMTAVREKINLVTIVLDNSVYGAERRNQFDFFNERYFWTDLQNPNFAQIAKDMGAVGLRVEKPAELGPSIAKALKMERPVVIDAVLDPKALSEPYRRDAMRQPQRFLSAYQA